MASNLRQLLIQRAARLQARPALTAPDWGTLSHGAWRNRVEGIALGLMAEVPPPTAIFSETGTAWDWAMEVAAACAGIPWVAAAPRADPTLFGGSRFNDENGRRAYHDREENLNADAPFDTRRTHGDMLLSLQRWNRRLGWDHDTVLNLPLSATATEPGRAALWNLLYAGGHARLLEDSPPASRGLIPRFKREPNTPGWNPQLFEGFWKESG